MIYLAARRILETTNDEDAAWDVARHDAELLKGVTKEQWIAFARQHIARDRFAAEARTKGLLGPSLSPQEK